MKLALSLLALLFLGVIGAHFLIEDRGQVLVSIREYTVQTSVPVLVLLLVLAYLAVRLVLRIVRIPRNIGRAAATLRVRRARDALTEGLLALSAGDWARGERVLGRSAHDSDAPLLHYLAAARAAERLGAPERRDRWLALAAEVKEGGPAAVLLAQAEALMAGGQHAQALAALRELDALAPNNAQGAVLRAQACAQTADWAGVRSVLPRLRAAGALPAPELDELELRAGTAALAAAAERGADEVRQAWRALPRQLGARAEAQRAYADALAAAGDVTGAEEALRRALETRWDAELVRRYGELETADPAQQLKRAEAWLASHPEDPALLLAVGRLCARNQLWGKARSCFESSLAIAPEAATCYAYGRLLEQLGETEHAAETFRSGLALAAGATATPAPRLPRPAASA
jgi:HemY protein